MIDKSFQNDIRDYVKWWNKAEEAIKRAELIRGELVVASVNELRYAGRKFVDALDLMCAGASDLDGESRARSIKEMLSEAKENCVRARNDAVDAVVVFIHAYFKLIQKDYGIFLMNSYFPEYLSLLDRINEVDVFISTSRRTRAGRNTIYDKIDEEYLPIINDLYHKIEKSKDLIDEDTNRVKRTELIKLSISYAFGAGGVILALLAWI